MLCMNEVKRLCTDDTILMTVHVRDRMKLRGILYSDLVLAISNGEIIEQYENDTPYPSCLVHGYTADKCHLHAVVSIGSGMLWIITTYYPASDKWHNNYKTRKVDK